MDLRQRLQIDLTDEEYRHAYADEQLNLSIGTQIKVVREQQGMTQAELAQKIGTKQAGISRLESANYDGWSIAALRRLARAFDLRLRVTFEEFGTLWKEVGDFNRQSLKRDKFKDDPEFKKAEQKLEREASAKAILATADIGKTAAAALKALSSVGEISAIHSISAAAATLGELVTASGGGASMLESLGKRPEFAALLGVNPISSCLAMPSLELQKILETIQSPSKHLSGLAAALAPLNLAANLYEPRTSQQDPGAESLERITSGIAGEPSEAAEPPSWLTQQNPKVVFIDSARARKKRKLAQQGSSRRKKFAALGG